MYNLLAVVVSVAIGVFMAAAGVFYSGSAFTTASAKAQAMQIISSMEQIDSAWTMWSNDGATTTASAPAINGTGSLTAASPYAYLSSFPNPPNTATTWGTGAAGLANYYINSVNFGTTGFASPQVINSGILLVMSSTTGLGTCLEIARAAGMVSQSATAFPTTKTITNWYNSATTATVASTTVNTGSGGGGIQSDTELNALAATYRFFCVPLGTPAGSPPSFTGNQNGGAALATIAGDSGKFLAFFKHQ